MALPINQQNALPLPAAGAIPLGPVVPGTGATELGKADGAPHTPGDVGVEMLGVVDDGSVAVPAVGDYTPPRIDPVTHGVIVGPVTPGVGATNLGKAEGAGFAAGDVGVEMLGVVDDGGGGVPVPAVGRYTPPRLDTHYGGLLISGIDAGGPDLLPLSAASNGDGTGTLGVRVQNSSITTIPLTVYPGAVGVVAPGIYALNPVLGCKYFGLSVRGLAVAATLWSVNLELSLDSVGWTSVLTHATVDGDGKTKWTVNPMPSIFFRLNVTALTLGPAASLTLSAIVSN